MEQVYFVWCFSVCSIKKCFFDFSFERCCLFFYIFPCFWIWWIGPSLLLLQFPRDSIIQGNNHFYSFTQSFNQGKRLSEATSSLIFPAAKTQITFLRILQSFNISNKFFRGKSLQPLRQTSISVIFFISLQSKLPTLSSSIIFFSV